MDENERLYERYEDAFFALLMNKVAEANGNSLIQKNKELLDDPSAAVPDSLRKRCLYTIEKSYRKKRLQRTAKKTLRTLNRVALWILVPIFMFIGVFAASETVRVKTMNLLIREFDIGTEFRMQGQTNASAEISLEKLSADQVSNAVPEDFSLTASNSTEFFERYTFKDDSGAEIRVTLHFLDGSNGAVTIDTENAVVWYEAIEIYDVMFIQKDNSYQAVWSDSITQTMYTVSGLNVSSETILNISRNLIEMSK